MMWYFSRADNISDFNEYFSFNQYPFNYIELWFQENELSGFYSIPDSLLNLTDTVLVMNVIEFIEIAEHNSTRLIHYLETNKIIVYQNIDSFVLFLSKKNIQTQLKNLDQQIPHKHIHIVLDAIPDTFCYLNDFKNIIVDVLPYNFFFCAPRITGASLEKNKDSKDFLLTAIKKSNREHRQMLWEELQKYPQLFDNAHAFYKTQEKQWVGRKNPHHAFNEGHPSMDLYSDSFIEVVPETLYDQGLFITEKTIKPIATKTPFLILSNYKYLKFLRNYGFKTFNTLIDESYDEYKHVQDRVKSLVASLRDIVNNGAADFYRQSTEILDHNHRRLLEISGGHIYHRDLYFQQLVDQLS